MRTITFSHKYKKMPPILTGTFITAVRKVEYQTLSEEFIKADTETVDGQFYPLQRGWLIFIELWTDGYKWQTLRPWTPDKLKYYKGLEGQEVEIVIDENYVPKHPIDNGVEL